MNKLVPVSPKKITEACTLPVPSIIARSGQRVGRRFIEFFTANIRNPNTREAYARAVGAFLTWCETRA